MSVQKPTVQGLHQQGNPMTNTEKAAQALTQARKARPDRMTQLALQEKAARLITKANQDKKK